jgi:hypothetical protein
MKTIILAFALAAVGIYGIAKAAPQTCPGDANGDNVVNILDLSLTVSNLYKGTAPYQYGDVDGDQIVTQADLDLEAANYGHVCVPVIMLSAE